jgi:uncharacterized protein
MKTAMSIAAVAMLLVACQSAPQSEQNPPQLGMANPASVYCVEQGGKLTIRDETNGQVGYCHLPNGQVVEEWALFRASSKQCEADAAKALVGQTLSSETQLKAKTQAGQVRILAPNQPATLDYRADRLTVVVDAKSQKIISANCG